MKTGTLTALSIMEERAEIWEKMQAIKAKADGNARGLTTSERRDFLRLSKQYEEMSEQIKVQEALEGGNLQPISQQRAINPAAAIGNAIYNIMLKETGEKRALTSSGVVGVLQDPDVQREVIDKLISMMVYPALGADMRTGTGVRNFARFPKVTGLPSVSWVASEGTGLNDDSAYTWSYVDLDFKTLATNVVKASFQLMDDSEINMQAQIGDDIMRSIANEVTRRIIDGATGSNQPDGLLSISGTETVAAGETALTSFDKIIDAIEILLNRNVPMERIGIVMSPEAGAQMQKMAATDNQPLQMPEWVKKIQDRGMLQYTTGVLNTGFGAGTETRIIVGDFSNLMVRGRQVTVSLQERYADSLQYGFIGYSRWAWAVKRPDFVIITGLTEQTT